MDGDFLLALRLQAEWEAEDSRVEPIASSSSSPLPARPLSVVDEAWELLDPSPDVRGLFLQFNETLFWGRLAAVEVKWSPRMTLCAGLCCYEGRGGMCSIRLSEPLLKLRPRKDLVETLLHEMIHALLFVTNNDKDHDGHGPEFCKHMHRINRLTGANVTIYHEFHDEVDSYRQHWWRCNGPCQTRKPYFGYVKRAVNRAPSSQDLWWSEHQRTCGGTYTKIKEPENYSKKGKEKNKQPKRSMNDTGRPHGDNTSTLIPFSGKGYLLGGKNVSSLEGAQSLRNNKSRELLSSQLYSLPDLVRENPKNKNTMEREPNVSHIHPPHPFSCQGDTNCTFIPTLPKVSVANTKAYTNVNGSPIRNVSFNRGQSNSNTTNAQWVLSPLKGTLKRSISESAVSSPSTQTASPGSVRTYVVPQKQTKTEDKVAFANYFIKKADPVLTSPSVKSNSELVHFENSTVSVSDQSRKVNCPVCHSDVLEAEINEHLDCCLGESLQ